MNGHVMLFGAVVVATSLFASDSALARDPVSPYDLSSEDYWQIRRISVAEVIEIDKQETLTPMVVFRLVKPINDDSEEATARISIHHINHYSQTTESYQEIEVQDAY